MPACSLARMAFRMESISASVKMSVKITYPSSWNLVWLKGTCGLIVNVRPAALASAMAAQRSGLRKEAEPCGCSRKIRSGSTL